ncbi:MAG: hypothetical protein Udaeo2_22380 [Candidatus Udaeobacter sp.]|nr:MAG: hypothetical protein Udaeo2_22380 [Candidatus Udaeobacter sp.]
MGLLTVTVAGCRSRSPPAGRADHGSGIRLAARGLPDIRSDPRFRHVDLRHVGLTVFMACVGLAAGPSFSGSEVGISLVFVGLVIAILRTRVYLVRSLCVEDEPRHCPGCLFRRRDDHRCASRVRKRRRATSASATRALRDWQHRAHGMGASLVAMMT